MTAMRHRAATAAIAREDISARYRVPVGVELSLAELSPHPSRSAATSRRRRARARRAGSAHCEGEASCSCGRCWSLGRAPRRRDFCGGASPRQAQPSSEVRCAVAIDRTFGRQENDHRRDLLPACWVLRQGTSGGHREACWCDRPGRGVGRGASRPRQRLHGGVRDHPAKCHPRTTASGVGEVRSRRRRCTGMRVAGPTCCPTCGSARDFTRQPAQGRGRSCVAV